MVETFKGQNAYFDKISRADSFKTRLVGLMGKKSLKEGEGLYFPNCSSIHCMFMKIPIDVVYLDDENKVLGVETVQPWKKGKSPKGCKHILEVGEGAAKELVVGEVLEIHRYPGKAPIR